MSLINIFVHMSLSEIEAILEGKNSIYSLIAKSGPGGAKNRSPAKNIMKNA